MAIKLHYGGSYDYFKYNGKTNLKWKQFEKFRGKKIIHTLLRKHGSKFVEYVATAFAYIPDIKWVGELNDAEAEAAWILHQSHMQSIRKVYRDELEFLLETHDYDIRKVLLGGGDLPAIEKSRIRGLTSIETCCILDEIFQYINRNDCTHPLWDKTVVIQKYSPFLGLNRSTFVDITKTVVPK